MDKEKIRYTFRVDSALWKRYIKHCNERKYQKNLVLENLIKDYLLKIDNNIK